MAREFVSQQEEPATPDWKRFLATGSAREVLARLVDGDPLGVRVRVAGRLRERFLLLDAERVSLRTLARVAREGCRYRGRPAFAAWLDERCDRAIEDILEEEQEAGLDPACRTPIAEEAFELLAKPLGIAVQDARRACVAFHGCSLEERRSFVLLVLEARPLDEVAEQLDESPTQIARRARRVLLSVIRNEAQELEVLP